MRSLSLTNIEIMNGRQAKALTTTIIRGQNLLASGYSIDLLVTGIYEVCGQPEKRGKKVIPHGPHQVNTLIGTCTCDQFASGGHCKHLECCELIEAGEIPMSLEALDKATWVLESETEPGKRRATAEGEVYLYRSEGLALNDARANKAALGGLRPVEVTFEALLGEGKYSGCILVMTGKTRTIPFPRRPVNTSQSGQERPGQAPAHNPWAAAPPYIPTDAELARFSPITEDYD